MSKVFIRNRSKKVRIDDNTGEIVPLTKAENILDNLDKFELILFDILRKKGHQLSIQPSDDSTDKEAEDVDFKIYWHETKKEVDGDLFYVSGHYRYLFTIDDTGWGASHSKMQKCPNFEVIDISLAQEFCTSLASELIQTGKSKHNQPEVRTIANLPNDYLFVPLQTERDYVIERHSSISVLEFIRTVSEWAIEKKQKLVFKQHPTGKFLFPNSISLVKEYVQKSNGLILELDENIHTLISQSKGVLLINSGVGFESLIHGVPVATFGDCDYKWTTFQTNKENIDKARDYLYSYTQNQRERAWKFVYFYYTKHAFDLRPSRLEESKIRLEKYLNEFFKKKSISENRKLLTDAY